MNFSAPLGEETQMAQSTVTLFNDSKIVFFIEQENGDEACVPLSANTGNGFKSHARSDRVTFEITKAPKRMQAVNVKKI